MKVAEHPNIELLRAGVNAFNSGDVNAVLATWNDQPIWHQGGDGPIAGTFRGREEYKDYWNRLQQRTDGTMKLDALEFLADDGHGAIIFETTAERKGRTLRVTSAYAVKFDDQGKQKEGWYCVSDQVAWDRFWADES